MWVVAEARNSDWRLVRSRDGLLAWATRGVMYGCGGGLCFLFDVVWRIMYVERVTVVTKESWIFELEKSNIARFFDFRMNLFIFIECIWKTWNRVRNFTETLPQNRYRHSTPIKQVSPQASYPASLSTAATHCNLADDESALRRVSLAQEQQQQLWPRRKLRLLTQLYNWRRCR